MKEASIYISGNLMPDTAVVQADHYRETFLELMAASKREDDLKNRLAEAESFVQKMVDCTKGQDSIATGYLSDILDVIKGKKL